MRIYNRKDFLKLPENTLYMKVLKGCYGFGSIEIKVCDPKDGWGNDFITEGFTDFMEKPFDDAGLFPKLGDTFSFSTNQSIRDGLFENDELYAVFNNDDVQQVIDKLKTCIK